MILLYNPPSSAGRKPILPMSLLALGAVLEGRHEYQLIDGNLVSDPLQALEQAIAETEASLLGVTVMPGPQLENAVPVCRTLKQRHPHLTIVWGGYFPTQHYDVCLAAPYVDYVVRGHGEFVFLALLDALFGQNGSSQPAIAIGGVEPAPLRALQEIPGLAFRQQHSGAITANPMAPIPHPRNLPSFPYHRLSIPAYIRNTFLGRRTLSHHSSYGCPFFCNFCAVVNMVNGRWLAQTAEQTAATVRLLVDTWKLDAVEFYDNNFFTHEARVADFSERIMDLGIHWWGEARIDTMLKFEERTWALMRDSGLRMVFLGAESGSDATLKRMNKGGQASTERTLQIARKMADYGIVPEMSFVLGNPPDPEGDARGTIEFIRRVKQVNPHTEIILYMYTPVPLSGELYDQARANGFAFPDTLEGWISDAWRDFSQRRSSTMPWLKDPLRRYVRDFERVLNAYYPTSTDASLHGSWRTILRGLSAWRYHLRIYGYPLELRAVQRLKRYQRPETAGF